MLRPSIIAFSTAAAFAIPQIAQSEPTVLAEFPTGTFLENLTLATNGATVFTSYFDRKLGALGEVNGASSFAELSVHPVGILGIDDGYIVTAHGTPFTEGPVSTKTQQILFLDESGKVTSTLLAPDALFLNGLTQLTTGQVLIADSIAGTIWSLDVQSQTLAPWLIHELLAQNPDLQVFAPGANGIKQDRDRLLVSNSGRGAIYEISLDAEGNPSSEPSLVAQTGPIDDFYVDGNRIVFATHSAALMAIEEDGAISTLLPEGCDSCTSVLRRGDEYIVLTTGGLLEGHTRPARILSVPTE